MLDVDNNLGVIDDITVPNDDPLTEGKININIKILVILTLFTFYQNTSAVRLIL